MRRTLVPATAMGAGAGGRRDFSGGGWRRGGGREPRDGGSEVEPMTSAGAEEAEWSRQRACETKCQIFF
jgi:hypothetical protein